jgi:hypothetical protein
MNAMARTTIQPTMTRDVTAPAVIFAFSMRVVGRSIAAPPVRTLRAIMPQG